MIRTIFAAGALALTAIAPFASSTALAAGMMSAEDVGTQPMMGVAPKDFVKKAAASDMFEIASAKAALMKSKTPAVDKFARMMIVDHTKTTNGLKAALMHDKKVPAPPKMLPADKQALLATLKSTPSADFDAVYWQQQLAAHQEAWAFTKGFSSDSPDPALKKAAANTVPVVEAHLGMIKSAMGSSGSM